MGFDKSRVYTAVNADEVKIGSKVIVANSIGNLKELLEEDMAELSDITRIDSEFSDRRFIVNEDTDRVQSFAFCYLVSEPEEKKLKWTDLKIGDVIRNKELPFIKHLITGIDEGAGQVFFCDSWTKSDELEEWEIVEE